MIPRLIALSALFLLGGVNAATKAQEQATTTIALPRRERSLDFFDAATLAYYLGLDPVTGERLAEAPAPSSTAHNVAVMFYAQWDRNSHGLAPSWDAIGQMLKAGTQKSNLIMALFDCELDQSHLALCHAAGVTHYPTLMFISPSRTFPHKPKVQKSKKALPHTTQFPGIWQYDKSVLDWLRTMQGLTIWSGFWNKAKNVPKGWWQAAHHDPQAAKMLPVGIPSGTGGTVGAAEIQQQAAKLKELQAEKEQYEEVTLRSSVMIDAVLFPVADPQNPNSTDPYMALSPLGWNETDASSQVLRTCVMEVALDYCVRLQTHKTNELVAAKTAAGSNDQTLAQLEAELKTMIGTAEPYCDIVESCVVEGFQKEACKPAQCPFKSAAACQYLSCCFEKSIREDYAKALGVELPKPGAAAPQKKRGWF